MEHRNNTHFAVCLQTHPMQKIMTECERGVEVWNGMDRKNGERI